MAIKRNLGGDRLGSGNKMEVEYGTYGRSSHNLDEKWSSSMAPGVLYPFLKKVGLNGDTFDININPGICTLPTRGPLFSSYKFQCDVFVIPMRLYNGIAHNNPVNIGMKMNQVYLPSIQIPAYSKSGKTFNHIAQNCLAKYLGISGIGRDGTSTTTKKMYSRYFNAIPFIGYYDVFKNFYANRQESNFYVLTADITSRSATQIAFARAMYISGISSQHQYEEFTINESEWENEFNPNYRWVDIYTNKSNEKGGITISDDYWDYIERGGTGWTQDKSGAWMYRVYFKKNTVLPENFMLRVETNTEIDGGLTPVLRPIKLENIDLVRQQILSYNNIGEEYSITATPSPEGNIEEFLEINASYNYGRCANEAPMNGLCLKTYQSDMFNSWIQTEWIEGDNGIAEISAVAIEDGKLKMDALLFAKKIYNLANRIAASGGTFYDWQEVVYGQKVVHMAETPMYVGGLSKEIVFERVVSQAVTETDEQSAELGSLGGTGRFNDKHKGGHMIIHITEPSYIMGIVSLTPRISYCQGNEWDMTDLKTYDDLHKPGLDGIGFQDLIGEQMAWFDTEVTDPWHVTRNTYGKLPAWINYMTSYDKTFGDFAGDGDKAFMVLTRQYEQAEDGTIADATTYIDPHKYNYAFAYNEIDAQNFWCMINTSIEARRVMSAKIIPNL